MTVLVPAEWAPHRAMWLGFPSHAEVWAEDLDLAQAQVAALARALAGPGKERVRLMTGSPEGEIAARRLLEGVAGEAELNQADSIHPNPEGARLVARTVFGALEPMLKP